MQILNIAGYLFISLDKLPELRGQLYDACESLGLKGTILLSEEGININLAGTRREIENLKAIFKKDTRFAGIAFKESYSLQIPFKRLKVKIKKEIITMRQDDIAPQYKRAPDISPQEFKRWLDENRDITVLDTRNDYEVRFGTFSGAINLHINDFSQFPEAANRLDCSKPVVMFCTGGIRCEKAALHLLKNNVEVYQLEGGILNYFAEVGASHYDGECFVFDERIAVDAQLQPANTTQCVQCQGPVKEMICPCIN